MNAFRVLIVFLAMALAGCMNSAARTEVASADLSKIKVLYVQHFAPDSRGIDKLIAAELRQMGYRATSGAAPPDNVDAVVTYVDKWRWDMSMYMLGLAIKIREPDTEFPIAEGNSVHASLTRQSPDEMVREVLLSIFGNSQLAQAP